MPFSSALEVGKSDRVYHLLPSPHPPHTACVTLPVTVLSIKQDSPPMQSHRFPVPGGSEAKYLLGDIYRCYHPVPSGNTNLYLTHTLYFASLFCSHSECMSSAGQLCSVMYILAAHSDHGLLSCFYPLDKIYNHSPVSIGAQHPGLLSSVFPCLAPQKREATNLVWSALHSCCCLVVHIACWRTTLRGFVKWLDVDAGWVMFALVDKREIAVESFGLSRSALA